MVGIIIPLFAGIGGAVAGAFGGYFLGNRSVSKQLKIKNLREAGRTYIDMIRNIDLLLNNPEFLRAYEDLNKIYKTLTEISFPDHISSSEFEQYKSWRHISRAKNGYGPRSH